MNINSSELTGSSILTGSLNTSVSQYVCSDWLIFDNQEDATILKLIGKI